MSLSTAQGELPVVIIAALDRRSAIGRDNALPWRLPDDLKRFKALTLGQPLLMGRKTAESLGRALPGRQNIVLSRRLEAPFEGMQAAASLEHALALVEPAANAAEVRLCVIGGGDIYAQLLPFADRLHLTHVDTEVAGADAYFPIVDPTQWQAISRQSHGSDDRHAHPFEFADYERSTSPGQG